MMKATLTFSTRVQANEFATAWTRYSLRGHTVSSGLTNVTVTIYDVTDEEKHWVDGYAELLNA